MREVLEDPSIVCEVRVQHRLTVVLVATPEDVVMRARNHLNGVQLYKAKPFDDAVEVDRSCWLS